LKQILGKNEKYSEKNIKKNNKKNIRFFVYILDKLL